MIKIKNIEKRLWLILLLFSIFLFAFCVKKVKASSDVIANDESGVPDKFLYREILFELDKKDNETFTREEAESIYDLNTVNYSGKRKIKSLKGIENLKNLRKLVIHENSLTKLEGIDKLVNLESLKIEKGKLKNIDELETLTKITILSLEGSRLENWDTVGKMTQLKSLNISDCNLSDKKVKEIIKKLINLEILYANNNNVKSLSSICDLDCLNELYLANNNISNIKGLEKLSGLVCLNLSNNNIKRLVDLRNLSKLSLEYTTFEKNKISRKQFKHNLSRHMLNERWWVNNQVILQRIKKKLKIYKIKSSSKLIKGTTEAKAIVTLMTSKGRKIKTVKANRKGKFIFKSLNLKKYKGKKLKVTVYQKYKDNINGEHRKMIVRSVKFRVK